MEQRLAALFASVGNALDSSTYTYSDSDYLVRKALIEFLDGENSLVASARKIQDSSEVVDSILNYIVSTDFSAEDPADWYRKAARIVVEFSDFAFRNEMSADSARYAALLPEGHPRALNSLTLTASAQRNALAEWMAADPRLTEEASAQIFKLYSMSDEASELDIEFEYLKAEAMVASGAMPEELLPLTAAFNLTRAQRSAISSFFAQFRRRDRKGRFAEEFGRLSLIFSSKNGDFFSQAPKVVGPGSTPEKVVVEFDGSDSRIPKGLYEVDAALGENVKAYLPVSAVKDLPKGKEVVAEADKKFAIGLDDLLASKMDTPLNWEKSGKGFKSKDGKFVAEPVSTADAQKAIDRAGERGSDLIIAGTGEGDAFDPNAAETFLVSDAKGKTLGVAQDWAGIQEIGAANGMQIGSQGQSAEETNPFDQPMPFGRTSYKSPGLGGEIVNPLEPDLNQDAETLDKSKLSPDMIGEGYNFSKDGKDSWVKVDHGENGESYTVTKTDDGRWIVGEEAGSAPDNYTSRDLEVFDNALEAFEYANDLGARPSRFDEDWVNELMSEGGADLDQDTVPMNKIDGAKLSPEAKEAAQKYIDDVNNAVFNNNRAKINDSIAKAALDSNVTDEAYAELVRGRDAHDARGWEVENALANGSQDELEALLENPEYAGWADRIQDALSSYGEDGSVDLNQDAPVLSEKQSEPASGKQYAFLQEFLDERNLDPATEQAFKDALENKNLNKAQASAMIGLGRSADFKPGVDPNKPSERMLNSLQGYLATKDLAPSEIKDVLDSLQKDGSRDNVDALLNKLRRKKDKPSDMNQGVSSLTKYADGSYEWEDVYNNVNVNKTKNGWEVEYTNPDLNDDGGQTWNNRIFNSEAEALAFAEELVKQNQDDSGYGRAAGDLMSTVDLDQDVKGALTDPATDKQYEFLNSLLEGKKIDDPALEAAVRSAVEDRNLSKGEVGAFIGALRNLENKPNVRREPTAKQIASIKRGMLERGLSPEERKDLEDRLAAGMSFDEASEVLNDLKKRDITPQGMNDLLEKLTLDQDFDTLEYLLNKPEYSEFRDDIKDTMRQLALDTEDPRFQQAIDARESADVDLNQDAPNAKNVAVQALDAPEARREVKDLIDNASGSPETWTSPDGRVKVTVDADINENGDGITVADIEVDGENVGTVRNPDVDLIIDSLIDEKIPVDLNQAAGRSVSRDDLAKKLADDIDAKDVFLVSGDELTSAVEVFDSSKHSTSAGEMVSEVYEMAQSLDDKGEPGLAQRVREFANRLFDQMLDRFGFGDAGRFENGFDPIDLDDAQDAIRAEREMFFETDADEIERKLNDDESYGDARSGGAEVSVSQGEDGTWTASVTYDRGDDQFTGEDRDEVIRQAAEAAADYNRDVIPSSYQEDADLSKEATEAKTPEQASAFADKLDAIADDLDGNRGDPQLANDLRESAQSIRDAIARRESASQAETPDEPTTPETMDEMATDPDLNPAGYAEAVNDDLYKQFVASEEAVDPLGRVMSEKPAPGEYKSSDGRVVVTVEADADMDDDQMVDASYYDLKIDGVSIATNRLGWSDEVAAEVAQLVEEHFSKKA